MNKSDSITNLAVALAKVQEVMPAAALNATNPFLKNKYADLGSVIETAKPVIAAHGISVAQFPVGESGSIGVETIVMHESGEWISNTLSLEVTDEKGKSAAQVAGSIISYLRRYSYAAALGMYAGDDDDGSHPSKQAPKKAAAPTTVTASQKMFKSEIKQAIVDKGLAENAFAAAGMLDHSNLPLDVTTLIAIAWANNYRSAREDGKTTPEAAELANSAYTEYVNSK